MLRSRTMVLEDQGNRGILGLAFQKQCSSRTLVVSPKKEGVGYDLEITDSKTGIVYKNSRMKELPLVKDWNKDRFHCSGMITPWIGKAIKGLIKDPETDLYDPTIDTRSSGELYGMS